MGALCRFDDSGATLRIVCPDNEARVAASRTQEPPLALFEFVASQFGGASQANNAKDGTSHAEARRAMKTSLAEA